MSAERGPLDAALEEIARRERDARAADERKRARAASEAIKIDALAADFLRRALGPDARRDGTAPKAETVSLGFPRMQRREGWLSGKVKWTPAGPAPETLDVFVLQHVQLPGFETDYRPGVAIGPDSRWYTIDYGSQPYDPREPQPPQSYALSPLDPADMPAEGLDAAAVAAILARLLTHLDEKV